MRAWIISPSQSSAGVPRRTRRKLTPSARWGSPNPGWGSTARRSRLLEQALTLRRNVGDKRSEALTMLITWSDTPRPRRRAARGRLLRQALALYQGTGDKRGEAVAIGDLAAAEAALKRYPEARSSTGAARWRASARSATAATRPAPSTSRSNCARQRRPDGGRGPRGRGATNDRRGQRTGREPAAAHRLFLQSARCRAASTSTC